MGAINVISIEFAKRAVDAVLMMSVVRMVAVVATEEKAGECAMRVDWLFDQLKPTTDEDYIKLFADGELKTNIPVPAAELDLIKFELAYVRELYETVAVQKVFEA